MGETGGAVGRGWRRRAWQGRGHEERAGQYQLVSVSQTVNRFCPGEVGVSPAFRESLDQVGLREKRRLSHPHISKLLYTYVCIPLG